MDNRARIADIQSILREGARQVVVDGTTVIYDFDSLRRELRELMREDELQRRRRPTASTINLGGF